MRGVTRYDKRIWIFAAGLSALAGFVDAVGFIELGGFFVSFMSGNSTRLAVGIAGGLPAVAALAGSLIGCFVLGVMAGTLAARRGGRQRGPVVLALVALLLALAALVGAQGEVAIAALLMAAAMGAENAVFEREGEVAIGLTYMTGTLVKLGQRATAALLGGDRWGWVPYLMLWAGLIAGAVAGA
ncbi:MAG: YoaK family protein, partial [Sphingomonadaceae bacterium]|nr:YoaK family protein [Sphingomonadaceae bacterium]